MIGLKKVDLQRFLFLFLFIAIIAIKIPILRVYEILFYLSFEYLNANKKYTQLKNHNLYNWLFIAFLGFVILVRADLFGFSETTEYHLNSAEHLFFACIICLTITLYLNLFNILTNKPFLTLFFVFIGFNGIGLLNEFFQNFFEQTPTFRLKENDVKDIIINLIGSSLYVFFVCSFKLKK
jgi:hypothetical protein